MKKYLSIVLAIVMMFTICIPAFAEDQVIDQDSASKSADVDVYTIPDNAESEYTVTIPAELGIEWNDTTENEIEYTVYTNLLYDTSLAVVAAADANGVMTSDVEEETLTFALTKNGAQTFTGYNAEGTAPTTQPAVQINDFTVAPIGEYHGSVTFTVTYTPAD